MEDKVVVPVAPRIVGEEKASLYDKQFWPFTNELRDETLVTTTAGFLRKLRDEQVARVCGLPLEMDFDFLIGD